MSYVLIIGSNSDIAKSCCSILGKNKTNLILCGRNADEMKRFADDLTVRHEIDVKTIVFDALDGLSVKRMLQEAESVGYEGVLLAFGSLFAEQEKRSFLSDNSMEEYAEEARKLLEINFSSPVLMLERISFYLQNKKSGYITVISSVAGDRGRQSNYLYGSAKGGLSVYLQGLRNRMMPYNVHVLTVKPGFVDTKMTKGLIKNSPLVASPDEAASSIFKGIAKRKNTVYTKWFWRYIMLIIKLIPESIFKKLKL